MFEFNRNGIHVVKYRIIWFCLSALLLIPGIIGMVYSMVTYPTHSPVKVGIDYTGGTILQYATKTEVSNSEVGNITESLAKNGVTGTYVQVLKVNPTAEDPTNSMISVRTKFIDEGSPEADKITNVIENKYSDAELVQVSSVGPTLSSELFRNSLIALLAAILIIIAYISFRFEFKYAVSAILGLVHDVTFVMGVFSLLGIFFNVEVDGLFLTAMLTVIGYSVNDTIVTYDRIRENLRYNGKKMAFGEIVDASVQQTIVRSMNTSLTTFIALAALYFFGGVTTKDFVLAMMLGTLIGTYSSIFFCSMLIDFWVERSTKKKAAA